jgi:SPP1 family predicted phage head-tail adaptor
MPKQCLDYLPAKMDKRVTIQNVSQATDNQGGFTETWPDGASVSAWIQPMKGHERFQAMQMQTPMTHKIVMRYRTDVTTASRLKYGSRIFWVREVLNPDEAGHFLEIKAQERA